MNPVNGLTNIRQTTNGLTTDNVARPNGDYIGFNPTQNQAEYGTPRTSGYGEQIRNTYAYGQFNYFPMFPFRGVRDYVGAQRYGHPVSEMLYARLRGYRGILPINQLPLINKPLPYTVPVYSQFGEA